MITIVFDKNLMRAPAMEEFLAMDRNHAIALSDWTIIEMQKKNALTTSRESLAIAAKFPNQVFTLRPVGDILDDEVRSKGDAIKLIDYAESVRLGQLAADLRRVPPPDHLGPMMQEAEAYASTMIERLREEVANWEEALVGAAGDFTREERRAIATQQKISEATRLKANDLLLEATRNFMIHNQQKQGAEPMKVKDAMSMFAFRYSLCVLIHTLAWIREGAGRGKKLEKRVNDAIDLQVAAVGTFFEGTFSGDKQVRDVSFVARNTAAAVGRVCRRGLAAPEFDCAELGESEPLLHARGDLGLAGAASPVFEVEMASIDTVNQVCHFPDFVCRRCLNFSQIRKQIISVR